MRTFESRCAELGTLSKNWQTNSLFVLEAQKLTDEIVADATLLLATGGNPANITGRTKMLKGLISDQSSWLWAQRGSVPEAEPVAVRWVLQ